MNGTNKSYYSMILSIIFSLILTLSLIFTTFIFFVISAPFYVENIIDPILQNKLPYEEVNRTKPPPVSIPCCKQKTNLTNFN